VAVTGSTREQDHLRAMQLGARGCLHKPVEEAELSDFLEELLPPEAQMSLPLRPAAKTSRPRALFTSSRVK
jgi:CheY-like chemotaxis protein